MYDHARNISGEDPEHIQWIYNTAIPKLQEWGYTVHVVKSKYDYITIFHKVIQRSKVPGRNGMIYGFPMSGRCSLNSTCKVPPINKFAKENQYTTNICGIAIDEPKRLERLHKKGNCRSYLEEYNLTEKDAYELCKQYDLLSPIYTNLSRGGCWFCPNKSVVYLARLKIYHPELYREFDILDKTPNKSHATFCYNKPWSLYQEKVDAYIAAHPDEFNQTNILFANLSYILRLLF